MRLFFFLLFSIVISGNTYASSSTANEKKTVELTDVVLQLRWHHQFQFAGYYAAREKGYYSDVGLNVEIREGHIEIDTVDEVIESKADFGVTNSELLLSRVQGKPVVVTAAIFQHSPLVILSRKSTGLINPQQLIGKRVKMPYSPRVIELHAMFKNEGIALEQLNLIDGEITEDDYFNPNFEAITAYLTNQTFYYQKNNVPYTVINPISYGIDFYGDCLFTSEREINRNMDRVVAVTKASIKGWQYAMNHSEEVIGIIINKYGSRKSKEHLRFEAKMLKGLIVPELVEIGHINPGRWRHIADTFVKNGFIEPGYDLDGFVFNPDPNTDDVVLRWAARIMMVIILVAVFTAVLLFIFNTRLQREVKERKRSEEAFKESEERFRLLINNADLLITIFDRNGKIVLMNNTAAKYNDLAPNKALGKSFYDLHDQEKAKEYENRIHEVMETEESRYYEDVVSFAVGDRWMTTNAQPMHNLRDEVYAVQIISQDITKRKMIEEELKRNEEQYRAVSEITSDFAYAYDMLDDRSLKLKWVTGAVKDITGYSLEELEAFEHSWKSIIHPEDRGLPETQLEQLKAGRASVVEYRIINKDKAISWLRDHAKLRNFCLDAAKPVRRIYGAIQDITESKRAHEALQLAYYDLEQRVENRTRELKKINSKLREEIRIRKETEEKLLYAKRHAENANRAKTEFLANVSHELRTPMHHILSYSQFGVVKFKTAPLSKLLHYFKQIRKTGDRLMVFLNDLLDLSKLETGSLAYDMKETDLMEIVKNTVSELDTSISNKGLRLSLRETEVDTRLVCDEHKIGQVVQNVLSNAVKFTDHNHAIAIYFEPSVLSIRNEDHSPFVVSALSVSVRDQGVGIPERELEAVFDKFVQSSKTRTGAGGTGLGLSICKEIVEAHKGIIYAENNPEGGATFTFTLPYEQ